MLTKLGQEHKLSVHGTCAGDPDSTQFLGRGVDITAVDGQRVNEANPIARDVASELTGFDKSMRPNEIGSPWAIRGSGFFTDPQHQDHLSIGFKQPIEPDWKPPADVAVHHEPAAAAVRSRTRLRRRPPAARRRSARPR